MKIENVKFLIVGQEVICPDGFGRINKIVNNSVADRYIKVNTYENNRGCHWDISNIEAINYRTGDML